MSRVTQLTLVTWVISLTWVPRVIRVTRVTWLSRVTWVTRVSLVTRVARVTKVTSVTWLTTVPFKSKLTLDSRSSRESRIETRLLRLDSRFLQDSSNRKGLCLQTIIKGFISSNLPSTLDTQLLRESTIFVQVLSNLLPSLTSKKISLLYKITNSTQRLILARNS